MCGRFTFAVSPELLAEIFGVPILQGLAPFYNIAPTQQVLAVRVTEEGKEAWFMSWRLIPSWAKDRSIGSRLTNARSELVHE